MRASVGSFVIYLGMARDVSTRGLGSFNVWDYPTWDLDALYAPVLAGQLPRDFCLFLSSSTARDDSGVLAPPGCSTLQILTFMPWEPFARWADVPPNERGTEYRSLRDQLTQRVLERVNESFPSLVGDIEVQRVATPLSNTDYTCAVRGGIYGPAHSPNQVGRGRFSTRTPIQGLFLTGAGVYSCGVAPCLAAGRAAAQLAEKRSLSDALREQWSANPVL
jgi:all-trans-retinol 13,14-reductase